MRRPPLLSEGRRHQLRHLPLVVDTIDYVVAPVVSGVRRARLDRTPGESREALFKRIAHNTALPTALGGALVGGLFAIERAGIGQGSLKGSTWLSGYDLIQLGAGAVHGVTMGVIEGFKPAALGLEPGEGSKSRRAARAALREARNNLLGDAAQMAAFKSLGIGWPGLD